jgi:hypothetical protein
MRIDDQRQATTPHGFASTDAPNETNRSAASADINGAILPVNSSAFDHCLCTRLHRPRRFVFDANSRRCGDVRMTDARECNPPSRRGRKSPVPEIANYRIPCFRWVRESPLTPVGAAQNRPPRVRIGQPELSAAPLRITGSLKPSTGSRPHRPSTPLPHDPPTFSKS